MDISRRRFFITSLTVAPLVLSSVRCHRPPERITPNMTVETGAFEPVYVKTERDGRLAEVEKELWDMFGNCRLCPRGCGVNRLKGETGVCSSTAQLKIASYGPHFGEERPLTGARGSGTIFFSNCNLLCCFCQNWEINHRGDGNNTPHDQLAEMMLSLQRRGCHNINLVTPTHIVPHTVKALRIAIHRGLRIPIVYNTGGYDSLEVLKKLDGIVDIYLPDFKFQDGTLAARYLHGAGDYPEVTAAGLKEMHRQVGELTVDARGVGRRGLLLRHLVMPENLAGTDVFTKWVAEELSPATYVNLMAQYRPEHKAFDFPEIARRITTKEWAQALAWAREAGLVNIDH